MHISEGADLKSPLGFADETAVSSSNSSTCSTPTTVVAASPDIIIESPEPEVAAPKIINTIRQMRNVNQAVQVYNPKSFINVLIIGDSNYQRIIQWNMKKENMVYCRDNIVPDDRFVAEMKKFMTADDMKKINFYCISTPLLCFKHGPNSPPNLNSLATFFKDLKMDKQVATQLKDVQLGGLCEAAGWPKFDLVIAGGIGFFDLVNWTSVMDEKELADFVKTYVKGFFSYLRKAFGTPVLWTEPWRVCPVKTDKSENSVQLANQKLFDAFMMKNNQKKLPAWLVYGRLAPKMLENDFVVMKRSVCPLYWKTIKATLYARSVVKTVKFIFACGGGDDKEGEQFIKDKFD
jgi:hypothetical protein